MTALTNRQKDWGSIRSSLCGSLLKTSITVFSPKLLFLQSKMPTCERGEWDLLGKGPLRWCLVLYSVPSHMVVRWVLASNYEVCEGFLLVTMDQSHAL